jgi:hypothetical protein
MGAKPMNKLLAVGIWVLAALGAVGLAHAVVPSPTVQFPTTGWNGYAPATIQCGELTGVNFNAATTDHAVAITAPTAYYTVEGVIILNASHTLTTATGGLFTAVSGGGTPIAADQALTVTGAAVGSVNSAMSLTVTDAPLTTLNAGTLYFRIGTAEGAAATADVKVRCKPLYY